MVLLLLIGGTAWQLAAGAADRPMPRIAYFGPDHPAIREQSDRIQKALRDRTGQNVKVDFVPRPADATQFKQRVRELAASRPLAVVTPSFPAAFLIAEEKLDLPVVIGGLADPSALGLIESMDRPGRDLTGYTYHLDLDEKRLALLKELAPKAKRIGMISDRHIKRQRLVHKQGKYEYHVEGAQVLPVLIETTEDALAAVARSRQDRIDAWYVRLSPPLYDIRQATRVVQAINATRLPAIYERLNFVEAGGLAAYEQVLPDREELWIRTLQLMVEGVPARDIPMARPHHFFTTFNTETAKAQGIRPDAAFLSRVDQVYPCAVREPMNCKRPVVR